MDVRKKLVCIAMAPLLAACSAIAGVLQWQSNELARAIIEVRAETMTLPQKQAYLREKLDFAVALIQAEALEKAKSILRKLRYDGEEDSYYWMYTTDGWCLVHGFSPEFEGKYRYYTPDDKGNLVNKPLIDAAAADPEGAFLAYRQLKPSTGEVTPKYAYGRLIPRWNVVVATGMYLNPVDQAKNSIYNELERRANNMMLWMTAIALAGALIVAFAGYLFVFREWRYGYQQFNSTAALLHSDARYDLLMARDVLARGNDQSNVNQAMTILDKADVRLRERSRKLLEAYHNHEQISDSLMPIQFSLMEATAFLCSQITDRAQAAGRVLCARLASVLSH